MMNKALGLTCAVCLMLMSGCGEKDAGTCPESGTEAFFKKAIDGYYKRHNESDAIARYKLAEPSHYDATTNWWMVPFDIDGQKLQALISCDGRLEITGR
ncbi:hypothetical protein [Pseudomonas syringae]|uniref:hypothetical protein n=1 Tax=Pseudomonas syringae TaxID=317 RepID=UPI000CDB9463|nr:hypothetical protein [Pseudomonas syringae]POP66549.1 hypothetical protein CXB35_22575 [Pseudomonas syringae]RYE72828.1 MAG: hypothetical protein EOO81_02370 [Oxalobacteraceae bacterium]